MPLFGVDSKTYAVEAAAAICSAAAVSPFVAAVDQAIVQNASGQATMGTSMANSLKTLFFRPHIFLTRPAHLMLLGVYSGTYMAANFVTAVCDAKDSNPTERNQMKFFVVSTCNLTLVISKDNAFTKMFGTGKPKPVPLSTNLAFVVRDLMTIGAYFDNAAELLLAHASHLGGGCWGEGSELDWLPSVRKARVRNVIHRCYFLQGLALAAAGKEWGLSVDLVDAVAARVAPLPCDAAETVVGIDRHARHDQLERVNCCRPLILLVNRALHQDQTAGTGGAELEFWEQLADYFLSILPEDMLQAQERENYSKYRNITAISWEDSVPGARNSDPVNEDGQKEKCVVM